MELQKHDEQRVKDRLRASAAVLEWFFVLLQDYFKRPCCFNCYIVCTFGLVDNLNLGLNSSAVDGYHWGLHIGIKHGLTNTTLSIQTTKINFLILHFVLFCWDKILSINIIIVKFTNSCILESKYMFILTVKRFWNFPHLALHLLLLFSRIWLENNS